VRIEGNGLRLLSCSRQRGGEQEEKRLCSVGYALNLGGIVYGCLSLGNCLLLYQDEENILGALEACAGVAFGDNVKTCAQMTSACGRLSIPLSFLCFCI